MEEFEKMAQLEFEDMEPVAEGETTDDVIEIPEVDEDPDEPSEQTAATASEAEPIPAEAAPAAPSTLEQAETETVRNG